MAPGIARFGNESRDIQSKNISNLLFLQKLMYSSQIPRLSLRTSRRCLVMIAPNINVDTGSRSWKQELQGSSADSCQQF
jgi:hypothetical protein